MHVFKLALTVDQLAGFDVEGHVGPEEAVAGNGRCITFSRVAATGEKPAQAAQTRISRPEIFQIDLLAFESHGETARFGEPEPHFAHDGCARHFRRRVSQFNRVVVELEIAGNGERTVAARAAEGIVAEAPGGEPRQALAREGHGAGEGARAFRPIQHAVEGEVGAPGQAGANIFQFQRTALARCFELQAAHRLLAKADLIDRDGDIGAAGGGQLIDEAIEQRTGKFQRNGAWGSGSTRRQLVEIKPFGIEFQIELHLIGPSDRRSPGDQLRQAALLQGDRDVVERDAASFGGHLRRYVEEGIRFGDFVFWFGVAPASAAGLTAKPAVEMRAAKVPSIVTASARSRAVPSRV